MDGSSRYMIVQDSKDSDGPGGVGINFGLWIATNIINDLVVIGRRRHQGQISDFAGNRLWPFRSFGTRLLFSSRSSSECIPDHRQSAFSHTHV
jgi:hypothetical protein